MNVFEITDKKFTKYGRVIQDVDVSGIITYLNSETPCPEDVIYVASDPAMEACDKAGAIQNQIFGELPVQIGYCNGHNRKLNALEYHKSSEINIMGTDAVFMLGSQQDIQPDGSYDSSKIEIFHAPKGSVIEVYATTLHYAPCHVGADGFRVGVVLPRGTNEELKFDGNKKDPLLFAVNKWLIGHPEGGLPKEAYIGIVGANTEWEGF